MTPEAAVTEWAGTLIIDASNVARETRPPDWANVERVHAAWVEGYGAPSSLHLVADRSLRRVLEREPSPANGRFAALCDSGTIRLVPHADSLILALASEEIEAERPVAVVSNDRFVLEAQSFPWLVGDRNHFFGFRLRQDDVRLEPQVMEFTLATMVGRQERAELKELGFTGPDDPRLAVGYRCDNDACWVHALRPERIHGLPALRNELPVCPGCDRPLVEIGQRPIRRKVLVDGRQEQSFLVEAGTSVVVGRNAAPQDRIVGLSAFAVRDDKLAKVSRRHFELAVRPLGRVEVRDVGSTNGTRVVRRGARGKVIAEEQLGPDWTDLGSRDQVLVGKSAILELSGERLARSTA